MKKIIAATLLLQSLLVFSQEEKAVYVKGNALLLPVLVINGGVEYQLNNKFTLQGDFLISPWKSFDGKHAQIYMVGGEGRYYFDKAFSKFYVGANVSIGAFNVQKWNYWSDDYYVFKDGTVSPYIHSNLYQKGISVIVGGTVGYQFKLSEKWNMDIFAGVGTSQDFYRGFDKVSGERYDDYPTQTRKWNRSGEIIPYRGGIMISYKIK